MHCYHFVGKTLRDGRPIPADGEWLHHTGPIVPCVSGLHASAHPFDALQFAPGETLCLVECAGEIIPHGTDKVACGSRRIIKRIDATQLLRRFAADQALSVAHLWNIPDIVRQYLTTLDESLRDAARDAAMDAASAARAAAWAAAWDAARAAARDASRAAGSAARASPTDAAWAAAWEASGAAPPAAWAAARDAACAARSAAWDAARAAARDAFKSLVDAAFKSIPCPVL